MMNKLISLAAGAALVALTGTAYAAQPQAAPAKKTLQLSDNQMDNVTAGAVGIANGASLALGEVTAVTFTQTSTYAQTVNPGRIAVGQAFSQALASGGFFFQAGAISHADTAASLP
jgi:NADPH-dependent curcumin reductase CurA